MLKSLEDGPNSVIYKRPDVVVIGGGLAGIIAAGELSKDGFHVLLLESGELKTSQLHNSLNSVESLDQVYHGAEAGRFRGLGGTSGYWGAALLPHLSEDLQAHPCGWHDGWGLNSKALLNVERRAEAVFGVEAGEYTLSEQVLPQLQSFLIRSPKWPIFKKRNTAKIYEKIIRNSDSLDVWLNATVTKISVDNNKKIITAKSSSGKTLLAECENVVVAAGAIESTRLLLLMDQDHNFELFGKKSQLGRGFHDHLSAPIGKLSIIDKERFYDTFNFHFCSGGMRNVRYELAPNVRQLEKLPAAFLHVGFYRSGFSGFDGLRELLQSVQRGIFPSKHSVKAILNDKSWLARAVWSRFVKKMVLPPDNSVFELHLVTEQLPHFENTISLSTNEVDRFGVPLAAVNWKVRDEDFKSFFDVARIARNEWSSSDLSSLSTLVPMREEEIRTRLLETGGIFHPAGTTRLSKDRISGVVGHNLETHSVRGLWILSTSVMPSVGGANPSFTLVQLAFNIVDDIRSRIKINDKFI